MCAQWTLTKWIMRPNFVHLLKCTDCPGVIFPHSFLLPVTITQHCFALTFHLLMVEHFQRLFRKSPAPSRWGLSIRKTRTCTAWRWVWCVWGCPWAAKSTALRNRSRSSCRSWCRSTKRFDGPCSYKGMVRVRQANFDILCGFKFF